MIFTSHWPMVSWNQRYFPGAGCLSCFFFFAENDFWQAGDQVLLGKLHTKNLKCGQAVSRLPVCKNHQQFVKPRYYTAKEMCWLRKWLTIFSLSTKQNNNIVFTPHVKNVILSDDVRLVEVLKSPSFNKALPF
jgi:hypothetical protein